MLMEMDGKNESARGQKSRDERGGISTLTVDRRLERNCFPRDCQYRVSKMNQTDLDHKVTAPLNLLCLCHIASPESQDRGVEMSVCSV